MATALACAERTENPENLRPLIPRRLDGPAIRRRAGKQVAEAALPRYRGPRNRCQRHRRRAMGDRRPKRKEARLGAESGPRTFPLAGVEWGRASPGSWGPGPLPDVRTDKLAASCDIAVQSSGQTGTINKKLGT